MSEAVRNGVNVKVVSEALSHSDPAITLRVYAHVIEEHGREEVLRATASVLAAPSDHDPPVGLRAL